MKIRDFIRTTSQDPEINAVQQNVDAAVTDLQNHPGLNFNDIVVITSASGDILVNHLLAKKYVGFTIVRKTVAVDVWESATVNPTPNKQLIINASAATTLTLRVY